MDKLSDGQALHLPSSWESGQVEVQIWTVPLPWTASESLPAARAGDEYSVQDYNDPPQSLVALRFACCGHPLFSTHRSCVSASTASQSRH